MVFRTHGMDGTPTYRTWIGLKSRCLNPSDKDYGKYGGRGIQVCGQWQRSFNNFLDDMGVKPIGLSLDRINVNGNYEPSNCRWATPRQQRVNRRPASKSGVRGVILEREKYRVRMLINGKYTHLGMFKTLEEAKAVRIKAEKEYWDGSYS